VWAQINACNYIFLREFGEPEENSLRLVIEEAKAVGPPEDLEAVPGKFIRGVRPIESDTTCQAFELVWPSYVAYSVRNESFCTDDEDESCEGRLLSLYSKSHFLDYVARATFASDDYACASRTQPSSLTEILSLTLVQTSGGGQDQCH
jgi:hypothetical protein